MLAVTLSVSVGLVNFVEMVELEAPAVILNLGLKKEMGSFLARSRSAASSRAVFLHGGS